MFSKCQQLCSWSLPLGLTDVQNTAGGNPSVRGIFTLGPTFVSIAHVFRGSDLFPWTNVTFSPLSVFSSLKNQTGETVGVTMRRRGASADNRTRTQQRYWLHLPWSTTPSCTFSQLHFANLQTLWLYAVYCWDILKYFIWVSVVLRVFNCFLKA